VASRGSAEAGAAGAGGGKVLVGSFDDELADELGQGGEDMDDGSLSTLAPIFAVALATHRPRYAFLAGLATAIGAGASMAFSGGLSETGDLTGRGSPYLCGARTGAGTFLGGVLRTLPFLIPACRVALLLAFSPSRPSC
jgi:hypothetical protein